MNKKILTGLGVVAGAYILYRIFKPKNTDKSKSKKSNFVGNFGTRVMFTLKNTTDQVQVVPLFNAYSNTQNSNVSISPSIAEFNRTLLNEPKLLQTIEVRASGSANQAQKPMQFMCKDASGEFKGKNVIPMVSAYQVSPDMTTVSPNITLDGECYLNYIVDPKQTVVLVFSYEVLKDKTGEAQPVINKTTIDPIKPKANKTKPKSKSPNYMLGVATAVVLGVIVFKNI